MRNIRTGTVMVGLVALTAVVFCYNVMAHIPPGPNIPGRMTGGGSIFTGPDDIVDGGSVPGTEIDIRVTHGFELHCNPDSQANNLEINIHQPGGNGARFHLEDLAYAHCWDDPSIEPNPPYAPFDHYWGSGFGRYNGVDGYCADWVFTDAGERGINDRIKFLRIWTGGQWCPVGDTSAPEHFVVWIDEPGHTLTFGNHQAHKDNEK